MKRKPYSVQEKEELLKSDAIVKIANSSVTYCPKFKVFAVKEYLKGKVPMQIFLDSGINIDLLGRRQAQNCLKRWRKTYKQSGEIGLLNEARGVGSSGRPSAKELTLEEKLKKLELQNAMLKQEVLFLKKQRGWD